MSFRGLLAGSLALAMLELVLSSSAATGRVSGLFTTVGAVVGHLLDPTLPAIPDLRDPAQKQAAMPAPTPTPTAPAPSPGRATRHAPTPTVSPAVKIA